MTYLILSETGQPLVALHETAGGFNLSHADAQNETEGDSEC